MDRKAPTFDLYLMTSRTDMAKRQVEAAIQRAQDLQTDVDKESRLARQFCKACHYFQRLAGQAFTSQPCACCNEPQSYSSTATDVLCMPCAKAHSLCKHCSGDIEMRATRRKWPETPDKAA